MDLIGQPDTAAFLAHVNDHPAAFLYNLLHRGMKLRAAVASRGTENIAGQALAVNPDQYVLLIFNIPENQRHMFQPVNLGLVNMNPEFAVRGRQFSGRAFRYQYFSLAAVGDQPRNRTPFQIVFFSKLIKLGNSGHGAVIIHYFADNTGRGQSRDSRHIHCRFSMSGAPEHAARPRHQRKNMTGNNEIIRG